MADGEGLKRTILGHDVPATMASNEAFPPSCSL